MPRCLSGSRRAPVCASIIIAPRMLPPDVSAVFDVSSWTVPSLFRVIQKYGGVDPEEMYRVFNMGIGMVVIVAGRDAGQALAVLKSAKARPVVVGRIEKGATPVVLANLAG